MSKKFSDFDENLYSGVIQVGITEKYIRIFKKYFRVKIWREIQIWLYDSNDVTKILVSVYHFKRNVERNLKMTEILKLVQN